MAPHASCRRHLRHLLATELAEADQAFALFDDFLRHESFNGAFCQRLLTAARQRRSASWDIRRLAALMLEHQILKLQCHDEHEFDLLFAELNLKGTRETGGGMASSVLK